MIIYTDISASKLDAISMLCIYLFIFFSDVQMTLRSIMNPKGGIVAVITPEGTEDSQFRRIAKMINKYGNFSAFSKGSMVLHIQFDSLLKLTEFWLAYLNGTLEKELLDIFVTDSIKEQQGSSNLSIDMGFQLNDYVTAAYDLTLRSPTAVDNEGKSLNELNILGTCQCRPNVCFQCMCINIIYSH